MSNAIFTNSGRSAVAKAIRAQTLWFAWGAGDDAWGAAPPAPPVSTAALAAEVGRRLIVSTRFVLPDPAGEIVTPQGRWAETAAPSGHLWVESKHDFSDAPDATIREYGLFVGGAAITAAPAGQRWFLPAEIADPGTLLIYQRIPPVIRNAATRESQELVISF